jgi:hypothetical protein
MLPVAEKIENNIQSTPLLHFIPQLIATQKRISMSKQVKLKGTIQQKLTWVKSGINKQLMTCHCSYGYFPLYLKGFRSLKSVNMFSALRGTLL